MVNLLVDKGAAFEVKDGQGRTPLDLAELNNLKLLVDSIHRRLGLAPVVQECAEADNSDIQVNSMEDAEPVGFQLEGAQLCQIPSGDLPALHDVVKLGDQDKVEAALTARCDVHEKVGHGMTPLHIAAIVGVMACADLLLRKGARTEDTCEGGFTPLFWAVQTNNTNLVGLLLSRGANVNHKNDQGRTPLHWAAAVPSKKLDGQTRVRMVTMLLQKKADPRVADNSNKTAGWLAQEAGFPEVAQAIERHMAPVQKVQEEDDD
jgi:ankyrin repeat protein